MATTKTADAALVEHPIVRVVACGSVDDGKSTLIGRLLAETDSVPDDILDYARNTRRSGSTIPQGEVDYSMLTDGLEAEHEQGITIDVAYRHLYLPSGRRAIIADAPGHEQYTRNMAVAASTADIAILLVDATRGIRPQTHRHLTVCALMGVRTVIVAINKMDAVGFKHVAFEEFAGGVRSAAARFDLEDVDVVPVSALTGDNVIERVDPDAVVPRADRARRAQRRGCRPAPRTTTRSPFRLPVQYIVRADNFRGYAGTVVGRRGPPRRQGRRSTRRARPTTVERSSPARARSTRPAPATPVMLTLETETDVTRGDLLVAPAEGARGRPRTRVRRPRSRPTWCGPARRSCATAGPTCCWPARSPCPPWSRRSAAGATSSPARRWPARTLKMNDIGHVEIATDTPVPLDPMRVAATPAASCWSSGSAATRWRPAWSGTRCGAPTTSYPHAFTVDREARAALKGQRPRVLWLTGLPGRRQVDDRRRPRAQAARHGPAHLRARRRRRAHRPQQGPRLHPRGPRRERPPGRPRRPS